MYLLTFQSNNIYFNFRYIAKILQYQNQLSDLHVTINKKSCPIIDANMKYCIL